MTGRASPGRSLAERQLDRPRALSSRWVSARAKVSSSDYCEETTKQLVGGHRMTRGTAYTGVLANAALKYRWRHFLRLQVAQGAEVVSSHST